MTTEELTDLDAWIAEHVLGLKHEPNPDDLTSDPSPRFYRHKTAKNERILVGTAYERKNLPNGLTHGISWANFSPTTNPAYAMVVLEVCAEKHCVMVWKSGDSWYANLSCGGERLGVAHSLPIAICLFAKALFS